MAMWRGFLVSLVLNTVWTAFWIPHLLYRQYWYPQAFDFVFWPLTLIIPGLINGLTLKTYFYSRLTWQEVRNITVLWSVSTLASGIGPLVIGLIYARRGLNLSFDRQPGIFLVVLSATAYGIIWFVQMMTVYPLHVLNVEALTYVIQIGMGLGALNAVAFHVLVMVARWLGRPRPQSASVEATDHPSPPADEMTEGGRV
ncbi:MAG: hypothetical protein MUF38_08950 [Anaerolineae bacterium]|jgi:hypothetical protein|nr:hypothetical protein [Anaerolineae bacterium]